MRILFVGDVFGKPGRCAVAAHLPQLIVEHSVNLCVVNGENAKGGRGLTREVAQMLYASGADVITLGNHAWDNKKIFEIIEEDERLVRAYNYPASVPGRGLVKIEAHSGHKVAVSQILCRLFMAPVECPFTRADQLLEEASDCTMILIDVHGEATSEKMALGWYLDGRVSAVIGTHTHVPTADERILPQGTAYITDVGMSGPYDSVIGLEIDSAVANFRSPIRHNFQVAAHNIKISAVLIDLDESTGKALAIRRLFLDAPLNHQ